MTASDPAVAAAERAMPQSSRDLGYYPSRDSITAAREALAPIRSRLETWRATWEEPPTWDEGGNTKHTVDLLLADLAKCVYPEDEL